MRSYCLAMHVHVGRRNVFVPRSKKVSGSSGAVPAKALRLTSWTISPAVSKSPTRRRTYANRVGIEATSSSPCDVTDVVGTQSDSRMPEIGAANPVKMSDLFSDVWGLTCQALRTVDLWGQAAKGAHGSLTKFPAGLAEHLHTQSRDLRVVVVADTMVFSIEGAETKDLEPGSFVTIPAGARHFAICRPASPCEVFLEQSGAMDVKFVEKR
jgi:quercetin dioxygenase-like cupin family protein